MYLVLMVAADRVIYVKAFRSWDLATFHADELVMDHRGVTNEMPDWEAGPYRTVFTHKGVSIMIEPCDEPEKADDRFRCREYGVNAT